ncbi:MAG TPA: hypothetical protein VGJ87_25815 [Roseiflexaceae bacterium]|jgi:hypothetical protein
MMNTATRPRSQPDDQPGIYLLGGPATAGPEIEPEIERLILCGDPCA